MEVMKTKTPDAVMRRLAGLPPGEMYKLFVKIDGYKYVLYAESDSLDYLKSGTSIFRRPWKIEKDGEIVEEGNK